MYSGQGLGLLSKILAADQFGREAYDGLKTSEEFNNPLTWKGLSSENLDGVILPGGHAKGMREYLESEILQNFVTDFFKTKKPLGAICHGVVLVSRSRTAELKSVLFGRKTTSLLASQELLDWSLTCPWLGPSPVPGLVTIIGLILRLLKLK